MTQTLGNRIACLLAYKTLGQERDHLVGCLGDEGLAGRVGHKGKIAGKWGGRVQVASPGAAKSWRQ